MRVYVAAPYADAPLVRDVHDRLLSIGAIPTSSWASTATAAEDFSQYTEDDLRVFAAENDRAIDSSDAMIVLARAGAGGEMFAEAARGLMRGMPLFWVGRRTLSAWRPGVVRCEDIDDALARIQASAIARRYARPFVEVP